jgi:hypothetical protein
MYASVRKYTVASGSMDELMHRVDTGFAEKISREPGFCSYQAIAAGDTTCITVTCFREETDAHNSADMAAEWIKEELADIEIERQDASSGEVMVSRAESEVLEAAHH